MSGRVYFNHSQTLLIKFPFCFLIHIFTSLEQHIIKTLKDSNVLSKSFPKHLNSSSCPEAPRFLILPTNNHAYPPASPRNNSLHMELRPKSTSQHHFHHIVFPRILSSRHSNIQNQIMVLSLLPCGLHQYVLSSLLSSTNKLLTRPQQWKWSATLLAPQRMEIPEVSSHTQSKRVSSSSRLASLQHRFI